MGLHKGQTNNPAGKPKGALCKKTLAQIERVEFVLSLLNDTLEKDIKTLDPKERIRLWNDLQEYIRPKLARTELTGGDGKDLLPPEYDLSKLSVEALKELKDAKVSGK